MQVEFGVAVADYQRQRIVAVAEGSQCIADEGVGSLGQCRQPAHGIHGRALVQHHGSLGDVGGIVANAFDVGGNAQCAVNLAQVARHGLAQGQQAQYVLAYLAFQRINGLVVGDDALRGLGIAADHHVDGGVQLRRRDLAHAGDFAVQALEFGVEALDDVFVGGCHGQSFSQTGR